MTLPWMAAIMLFVQLEKVLPLGDQGNRMMGALMVLAGLLALARLGLS